MNEEEGGERQVDDEDPSTVLSTVRATIFNAYCVPILAPAVRLLRWSAVYCP
jgi:hypothetical protein